MSESLLRCTIVITIARREAKRMAHKCPYFHKGGGFGVLALLDAAAVKKALSEQNLKRGLELTEETKVHKHP